MKKIISFVAIIALCAINLPAFSTSINNVAYNTGNGKDKEMSIVSSRTSGQAQVRFKTKKSCEAIIVVSDENGKVLLQQSSKLAGGVNNIAINDLLTLHEGTYTLTLTANKKSFSSSLMIWK